MSDTAKRASRSAQAPVTESAQAVLPAVEHVIEEELDNRGLAGADREAMKAAISALLPGMITERIGRAAALRHEQRFEGSKNRSHEVLGSLLGISRQSVVSRYHLGPEADGLRAELREDSGGRDAGL